MSIASGGYLKEISLEQENEQLKYKVEILENAIREIQEIVQDSAGVYWDYKRAGTRAVGNLCMNRWHELNEDLVSFNEAVNFLEEEQEDN